MDGLAADRQTGEACPPCGLQETVRWLCRQLRSAEDWGYFGPSSAIWALQREACLGVGLGRALLLQLAHPWVAQAVVDHSAVRDQPLDRLVRTVVAAELLVFGSRRQADAVVAHLRALHGRIRGTLPADVGAWRAGTPYRADDPDALLWVLVTLVDTTLRVYEAGLGRLAERTVGAYLADAARLGALLGVAGPVPADRVALERYMGAMIGSGIVAVGPAARTVATALVHVPVLPSLSWRVYSALTRAVATSMLPEELRAAYGPAFALHHSPLYSVGGVLARALLPRLPRRLRDDPIAAIAIERAARMGRPSEGAGRGGDARLLQLGASSQGYRDGLLRRGGPAIHGHQDPEVVRLPRPGRQRSQA
jgi:uncharacterized protein (DUF2236 family)